MRLSEKILLQLSKKQKNIPPRAQQTEWDVQTALKNLQKVFPQFVEKIKGKTILDYGCGFGYQSVAFILQGAKKVVGVDINNKRLELATQLAFSHEVQSHIEFKNHLDDHDQGVFDIVVSQNSMEHFPQPLQNLKEMANALNSHGEIFLTFGPPWYAPYGAHMQFFTNVPWVNILFSEETVMRVRSFYRSDGALKYEDVESGLNKMTIAKFEHLLKQSGLKINEGQYEGVKGLNFLSQIPRVREFFINQVNCILVKEKSHV